MPNRIVNRSVAGVLTATLWLALVITPALAAVPEDEARMVQLNTRFGNPTGPTSVGFESYTEISPGRRFMYVLQSAFESFSSGYSTTVEVEFPDSVVPRVSVYPAPFVQVVGNKVVIQWDNHGGVGLNLPFDVKAEGELPAGAAEIRMKTHITVETENSGTLQNSIEDVLGIVRSSAFSATAAAAPAEVQLTDPEATITVTVTLQNTGNDALSNVAPAEDPVPSIADAVERTVGPTPPSVDLAPGASGTITYRYVPKKAGRVTFAFARFLAQGPSGVVDGGPATTNEVAIKDDVTVDVTIAPSSLPTDSTTSSSATIRVKLTNPKGEPVSGQRVAVNFPQFFGVVDLNPRLLVCGSDGAIVFPPGANPTLLRAASGITPTSGEVTWQLHLGTQRRTAQLLVTAAALGESDLEVADDGAFADLPPTGAVPNPTAHADLDALQRSDLPPAQQADDSASIVGRGTPFEVLQALVRWLETKREAGPGLLREVDWVPIASRDDQHAGVLIYARAQLDAVVDHFDTGSAVANAYVLQIEKSQLGLAGHEVKWQRPWMPLDTWENTPLDSGGLPIPGSTEIPRLRAKPAIDLVTASPYAFLGYPYPAAGASADGGYGAGCVPTLNGVSVSVHSPVTLLVKDAQGRGLGFDAGGAYVNDIPSAVYVGGEPARYLLPPGNYQADIVGTGKGPATIVLSAPGVAPKTLTLKAKSGKTGTLEFDDTLGAVRGTFSRKRLKVAAGVPITVGGLKKKIKVRSGDPLTLTVKSAFGGPVAGARVRAVGNAFDAETLTGADGVATLPLVVTKATKKLTVTIDGAGVQPKSLKLRVKLLK